MKILVDTPIWSMAFRRKKIKPADKNIVASLKYLIEEFMEALIGPIRQEILSGISDEKTFNDLKEKMKGFNDFSIGTKDYELAADYSNICRKKGMQGSNTDFLICAVAVRNEFEIYTMDNDFNQYKKYLPIKLFDIKTIGHFA
jgi:predicted nucleic acid-binding protein